MSLEVIEESGTFTIMLYTSSVGAILAFITSCILFIDVIHNYIKMRKKNDSHKLPYILVSIYLFLSTFASFSYAFIRTNAISRLDATEFTVTQCIIGFLISYIMYYLSVALFYMIYAWRVNQTLKNSQFHIHRYILYIFYSVIITSVTFFVIIHIYEAFEISEWVILKHNGVLMCANGIIYPLWYDYIWIYSIIFNFMMNICLLSLFIRGLWRVNAKFIQMFVEEHCESVSENSCDSPSNHIEMQQTDITVVFDKCTNHHRNTSLQMKHSIRNAQTILILHDLMKKQTILASISVVSSVLLWIIIEFDDWFTLQIYWDVIINVICAWLMLASSKKYWRVCTKTCLTCCYKSENIIRKKKKIPS